MGGVVVRDFILQHAETMRDQVQFVYFFGTPTNGSQVADIVTRVYQTPQLKQLQGIEPDSYLADSMRNWLNKEFPFPCYAAYETEPYLHLKIVVTMDSAVALANRRVLAIPRDHVNLVKPANEKDEAYIALRNAINTEQWRWLTLCERGSPTYTWSKTQIESFESAGVSGKSQDDGNRKVRVWNQSGSACAVLLIDRTAVAAVEPKSEINLHQCAEVAESEWCEFNLNEFRRSTGEFLIVIRRMAEGGEVKDYAVGLINLFQKDNERLMVVAREDRDMPVKIAQVPPEIEERSK